MPSQDWIDECTKWCGRVLTGKYSHWCPDWDFLPIDETRDEWPCVCADDLKKERDDGSQQSLLFD